MKKIAIATAAVVLASSIAWGYEIHHPNMREAYMQVQSAMQHVQEAQAANKGIEFGGHADRALEALKHAQDEIVAGDQYNDAHHK